MTPIDQPANDDVEHTARQVLERHIRMNDGFCRECFTRHPSRLVFHPCESAKWAMRVLKEPPLSQGID
jgi:hypothetical protein